MPGDPLEILRQPVTPIAPPAAFAADLRRRLQAALDLTPEGAAMTSTPSTMNSPAADATAQPAVSVYLCATGASAAIDFYREAFGAVETMRMTADDGRIGHAVEERLQGWGVTVQAADPYVAGTMPLDDLLRTSDIVSVHVVLTRETRNLIGARAS